MTADQAKLEIFRLKQRQERVYRRFFFEDCGIMVCEHDAAIRAIAKLGARIRLLTDRLPSLAAA